MGSERADAIARYFRGPRATLSHTPPLPTHRLHAGSLHVALQRLFEAEAGKDEALEGQLEAQPLAALLSARSEVPLVEVIRNQRVRADIHNDRVVVEAQPQFEIGKGGEVAQCARKARSD